MKPPTATRVFLGPRFYGAFLYLLMSRQRDNLGKSVACISHAFTVRHPGLMKRGFCLFFYAKNEVIGEYVR